MIRFIVFCQLIYLYQHMSESQQSGEQAIAIQKYIDTSKVLFNKVVNFDYKRFFQDILTFISIIFAYFIVSTTYQLSSYLQKIIKINLNKAETIVHFFMALSIYLISWNVIAYIMWKRALKLPPKTDEYEEMSSDVPPAEPSLQQLPKGEKHYHQIVYQALDKTIYFFLLLIALTAHSYFNQPQKKNLVQLVDIQKINLLSLWFLSANFFYLIGGLLQKITRMGEFKVLGIAIGVIIGCLLLGLGNGLNTFIFI